MMGIVLLLFIDLAAKIWIEFFMHLFIDQHFVCGQFIEIPPKKLHHLVHVRRYKKGDCITIFNNNQGTWHATIDDCKKVGVVLLVGPQLRPQDTPTNIHVALGLVKNDTVSLIIHQGTQLGVTSFFPLVMNNSNTSKINTEKWQTYIIEASQQCERNHLPVLHQTQTLQHFVEGVINPPVNTPFITWCVALEPRLFLKSSTNKNLNANDQFFNEERFYHYTYDKSGNFCKNPLLTKPLGLIVGPEGGFSEAECSFFESQVDNFTFLCLGPLVLRSETAIACGLSYLNTTRIT